MDKKAKNVSELLKKSSLSKEFKETTEKEIRKRSLSKFLFALRCDHKLTQKELAEKIGCTQGTISKLESSYDNEITVRDLLNYGKALNLQLELGYRTRGAKIADLVKFHAIKIKMYLEDLVKLAQEDKSLDEGVARFGDEVLSNMVNFIKDSVSKLQFAKKKSPPEKKEQIHLSTPIDMKQIDQAEKEELV